MNSVSPEARISPLADLDTSSRGSRLIVELRAVIDAFVKIKFAGGEGDVKLGRRTYLNSGVVIYSGNGVTLGDDVLVGANSTFAAANHEFAARDSTILEQRFQPSRGGILVEDDVWIGANCVILGWCGPSNWMRHRRSLPCERRGRGVLDKLRNPAPKARLPRSGYLASVLFSPRRQCHFFGKADTRPESRSVAIK